MLVYQMNLDSFSLRHHAHYAQSTYQVLIIYLSLVYQGVSKLFKLFIQKRLVNCNSNEVEADIEYVDGM